MDCDDEQAELRDNPDDNLELPDNENLSSLPRTTW